ncbi:helix-turn-helix domain-containing protein [Paraburkholderia sp. BCC1876]|uniref:helix-turn-helix domain-containing protein n=1 Tax=Paraburkholderia sp. BCC1876 TaxID=2676303 RepID=UPI001590748A|nr:helix-turn-helix domain-containing protein [Paraburkholderia sp. BCC1876]
MPRDFDATSAEGRMLSIEEIADILNVSRPFAVTLADAGKLGVVERGEDGQRRIPAAAVKTYHSERRAKARAALDELGAISQGAGLYGSDVKKV